MQNLMNDDEELDGGDGFIPATNPTKEDYDAVVKQNARLYARIQKEKERRAKAGDPAPAAKPAEQQTPPAAKPEDDKWREAMELKTDGYSSEEVAFIQKNGGRAAIDDPFVKAALESIRNQKKAEAAQVSDATPKSDVEKQYTDQQLREMKTEDLEKLLPKA